MRRLEGAASPAREGGREKPTPEETIPSAAADERLPLKMLPESDKSDLNFTETELTLGLPGASKSSGGKRGFSETVDLCLGSCGSQPCGRESDEQSINSPGNQVSRAGKPPAAKAQVVGWPPVRSYRRQVLKTCTYVKVAVDGAPYLRKVDLELYGSYRQLLKALEDMFTCFTIRECDDDGRKLVDPVNGTEFVPAYEDKDGDWMMLGDVPWKMFVESCKRMRLMKNSEASNLAPRTPQRCTNLP